MKNLLVLLVGLLSISCFGSIQTHAQKKVKSKEVIIVEIITLGDNETDKHEIPINRTASESTWVGGGRGVSCDYADPSKVSPSDRYDCPVSYEFEAAAWRAGKDKTEISFRAIADKEHDEECHARKVFMVYKGKQANFKLKCGINLIAYYKFKSKKQN